MVFDQHEDVVNVDVHLFDQFHLKDQVVSDGFFVGPSAFTRLVVQVQVDAPVVFEVTRRDRVIAFEVVEGCQDVTQSEDLSHQDDEALLLLLRGDRPDGEGEVDAQLVHCFQVVGQVFAVGAQQHLSARFLVSKKGDRVFGGLFQVPEAHDVAVRFDRVEDSVGAREGLNEAVCPQVFVDPQGVERLGVEPGEEHVDDDHQVDAFLGEGAR